MALFEFRCAEDGAFEIRAPIGAPPTSAPCPGCGHEASRVYSKPMLMRAPRALVAAIDNAEKSAHEPEVVTSLPRLPRHQRTPVLPLTPKLRGLPRP